MKDKNWVGDRRIFSTHEVLRRLLSHHMLPFSHLVVYKRTQMNDTLRKQHWTGYLEDNRVTSLAVRWCDDTVSHYGPGALNDGLDPAFYTEAMLEQDLDAGHLLVQAFRRLRDGDTTFTICDCPTKRATTAAITAIKKHCRKPVRVSAESRWLYWLQEKVQEYPTDFTPPPPKACKCRVDGCTG